MDGAHVGEDEGDDLLGDGIGIGAGGVHDIDAALACVLGVDGVVAGACADDDLEIGECVDCCGINDF